MIPQITQLLQQFSELNTALLLLALVLLFVIAFKVLEMVMQTVLVSALSGGFYLALTYFIDSVTLTVDSLLFFTFIGGTLYTGYHLLTASYSIVSKLVKIPIKIIKSAVKTVKSLIRKLRSRKEN